MQDLQILLCQEGLAGVAWGLLWFNVPLRLPCEICSLLFWVKDGVTARKLLRRQQGVDLPSCWDWFGLEKAAASGAGMG